MGWHARRILLTDLAAIEDLFRREQGSKDLVLADVFNLIAGISTGAVTATAFRRA